MPKNFVCAFGEIKLFLMVSVRLLEGGVVCGGRSFKCLAWQLLPTLTTEVPFAGSTAQRAGARRSWGHRILHRLCSCHRWHDLHSRHHRSRHRLHACALRRIRVVLAAAHARNNATDAKAQNRNDSDHDPDNSANIRFLSGQLSGFLSVTVWSHRPPTARVLVKRHSENIDCRLEMWRVANKSPCAASIRFSTFCVSNAVCTSNTIRAGAPVIAAFGIAAVKLIVRTSIPWYCFR